MFSIGDFARLGRVSPRMLRHYDAIGLLRPAAVDPATGYRFYRASQLGQLNRILVLKDLGITLEQLRAILDGHVNADQLEGMLRLRQAQLRAQIAADTDRLASIVVKLAMMGGDCPVNSEEVVLKELPAMRVARLTATAASYGPEDISPVIQPLYPELFRRLEAAGVQPAGPEMACFEPAPGMSGAVTVHAAIPVTARPQPGYDFTIADLPHIARAAAIVHRGPMDAVTLSLWTVASWIEDHEYRLTGYHREVYLDYHPAEADQGVTDLQLPIAKDGAG